MQTIFDDDSMKVSAIENGKAHITLCFTGVGHTFGGGDLQSEEFMRTSTFSTALFIQDKHRSWGNNIDFLKLKSIIETFDAEKINAVGNSMGAFLAIVMSKFIDVSTVVAIVPQYSVSKQIMPDESRWDQYVQHIRDWRFPSLDGCYVDNTKYYILAGVGGLDDKHLQLMPNGRNVSKIYFRNRRFIHKTARALKEDGLLYDVIKDCFLQRDPSDIIRERLSRAEYRAFDGNEGK